MQTNPDDVTSRTEAQAKQEAADREAEYERERADQLRHLERSQFRFFVHLGLLMLALTLMLFSLIFIAGAGAQPFQDGCGRYLQRAADTTDAEVAFASLDHAIRYAEANGLTRGHSFYPPTPANDVGAWYARLRGARAKIAALTPATPYLERREAFIRLRATLLDPAPPGRLRIPKYAELHPYQYRVWGVQVGSAVLAVLTLYRLRRPGLL